MIWIHLVIVIVFIIIGSRFGGIGIGFAGAAGVLVLVMTGLKTGITENYIPWSVIGIIMTCISAVAALQIAGGLDHLVHLSEMLLRKHPKHIVFLAPLSTYILALLCGTGHTAYSLLPVIVDVSKGYKIRPSRSLSIAVVASQVAVAASPISAAMMLMVGFMAPLGVGYLQLLAVVIPTTLIGTLCGAVVASRQGCELEKDPVYQERMRKGLVAPAVSSRDTEYKPSPSAKPALLVFLLAIVAIIFYATITTKQFKIVAHPLMNNTAAVMLVMMTAAAIIMLITRKPMAQVTTQDTFRAGMTAAITILGVAWLGTTFMNGHMAQITQAIAAPLHSASWIFSLVLYFASPLLFSHAVTTSVFMPVAIKLGLSATVLVASYPAVANYYLAPTYPTTVAAIEMDDTGSTRIGKFFLNHPFIFPGVVSIGASILLSFAWTPIVIGA